MDRDVVFAGLAELARLHNGGVPDTVELAGAPVLSEWIVIPQEEGYIRLAGEVSGHPSIRDGWCTTSPVLKIADDVTWVRTVSRYYRLGDRLHDTGSTS